MNPTLWTCIVFESVIIVHLFFPTIFGSDFSTRHIVYTHTSTVNYTFSIEQRRTAYRCLPLLYLQPRIETYLGRISYRSYWMIGFWNAILAQHYCIRIDLLSSCSHIFFIYLLLNLIFLYLFCLTHSLEEYVANFKEALLATTFLKIFSISV